ncbi:uncharacterized protein LAJ45_04782 [Morchella importuna]|uniref:uncharacterized protein n=1 Tax=Morchella importuna TaxID=1174673 RepID=UPI001E8D08AD|nr:uncharacterized protein LAJ45_04782 [Morchella importuna]KAH8151080.1 hypothetical protein LAJ45_04782 [Morchella importuna]
MLDLSVLWFAYQLILPRASELADPRSTIFLDHLATTPSKGYGELRRRILLRKDSSFYLWRRQTWSLGLERHRLGLKKELLDNFPALSSKVIGGEDV